MDGVRTNGAYDDRSDATLLRDAAADPAAFSELYARHVGVVHAWLRQRSNGRRAISPPRPSRGPGSRGAASGMNARGRPCLGCGIAANVLAATVRRDRIEARHESGSVYRSTWPARTDIRKPKTGSLHIGVSPGHSSCFPRTSGKRSSYASSTSSRTSKLHRSGSTPRHRRGSEAPLRRLREIPTEGNTGLLNLKDQHPPATVDRDPADYRAAEERLFPPGLGALLIRARLSRRFYAAREEAYSGSASCGCSSAAAGARACTRTAASTAPRAANAAAARNAAWYPPLSDATSP